MQESNGYRDLGDLAAVSMRSTRPEPLDLGQVVAQLAPALVSLAWRGMIEVRRFPVGAARCGQDVVWERGVPTGWEQGILVDPDQLAAEARLLDRWSPGGGSPGLMVVGPTREGRRWL